MLNPFCYDGSKIIRDKPAGSSTEIWTFQPDPFCEGVIDNEAV